MRSRGRDVIDPEGQRYEKRFPKFPGTARCIDVIRSAQGAFLDSALADLQENLPSCAAEVIATSAAKPTRASKLSAGVPKE